MSSKNPYYEEDKWDSQIVHEWREAHGGSLAEDPRDQYPIITKNNAQEQETHKFVCEASTIGLHVGDWPIKLETTLGNGHPFIFHTHDVTPSGDLAGVRYLQSNGCISLLIIND